MKFPYEVQSIPTYPIVSRNREVERCPKVSRMRQLTFLNTRLQPAESRSIT